MLGRFRLRESQKELFEKRFEVVEGEFGGGGEGSAGGGVEEEEFLLFAHGGRGADGWQGGECGT